VLSALGLWGRGAGNRASRPANRTNAEHQRAGGKRDSRHPQGRLTRREGAAGSRCAHQRDDQLVADRAADRNDRWTVDKAITIPTEPAETDLLPLALQPFGAVPPLVSDIDLFVDDRWLDVSCWGTGELKQYDVSDPHNPRETGSVRLGGIVGRTPHPAAPELRLAGAPQMVEVSRDGRRVYATNSLYASWDDIFYPDGVGAWMARIDADIEFGGMTLDPRFFPHGDDFRGLRVHQTRLQAGDASSDSYCFVD
jgi:methanethiol oxidase